MSSVTAKLSTPINLSHFKIKKTFSTGIIAKIKLAIHSDTNQLVVLKILSKKDLIDKKFQEFAIREKMIWETLENPFIVNYLGCFQDPLNVYIIENYIPGGELFTLLKRKKKFSNELSVFYAAQIVLVLEYLHSKNIVYRDLKPENILIDKFGFLRITDFGFAKVVLPDQKTFTLTGCPDYLAPEVIQSRGHSTAVDWWALGVLIYEMLCGSPPFEADSPYETIKSILNSEIRFPDYISEEAKDLITKLLNPKPKYRLGNLENKSLDVKQHPWFQNLNWTELQEKRIVPPHIPRVLSDDDTSNFLECVETEQIGEQKEIFLDVFKEFGEVVPLK